MRFKRTALNYIVWGLLCVILFAGVGISAIGVSEKNSATNYLFYVAVFYALFLLVCVLLVVGYRIVRKLQAKKPIKEIKINGILETVLVFATVILALVLRFVIVYLNFDEQSVAQFTNTAVYYEYAIGNFDSLGTAANIAYVYANALKALFGIFTQTYIVVFILQAFMVLGVMLFTFYAIRDSLGKVASWVSLLLIAFLPGSVYLFMECTPGMFFAFLISMYFFFAVKVIRMGRKGKYTEKKHLLFFGFLGLLSGIICYFDIFGILLIPLSIFAFFSFKADNTSAQASRPWLQSIVYFAVTAVVLLVSLFGFPAGIHAGVSGIARYFASFLPREGINLTLLTPLYGNWDSLVLLVLSGLWILAFLKNKIDKAFLFAVAVIVMVAFQFFTFDHTDYIPLVSVCFSIIGAIGLASMGMIYASEEELVAIEEKEEARYTGIMEKWNPIFFRSGSVIRLGGELHADLVAEDNALNPVDATQSKTEEKAEEKQEEAAKEESTAQKVEDALPEAAVTEPVAEEVKEEPVVEEVKEEPAVEEIKAEKPVAEEIKAEKPVAEEVKVEEPAIEEVKAEEPAVEEVKVEEPAVEEIKAEEPAVEEIKAEEPVVEEVKAEEPAAEEVKEEHAPSETKPEAPKERVLPPYVPQKMILRTRGKLFTPVKKAEVELENNPDLLNKPAGQTGPLPVVPVSAPVPEHAPEITGHETTPVSVPEHVPFVAVPSMPVPAVVEVKAEESVAEEGKASETVTETVKEETEANEIKPEIKEEAKAAEIPAEVKTIDSVPETKVKEIKNPLPGPKPHTPKELVFDYEVKDDEWDYDLKDLGDKDDYDI